MASCIIDESHGVATHHLRCQACFNKLRRTDLAYQVREQDRKYKANYNLSRDDVQALKASNHYLCAICRIPEELTARGLVVDHNHLDGKVRRAICDPCNLGLAHFMESTTTLQAAISYLTTELADVA